MLAISTAAPGFNRRFFPLFFTQFFGAFNDNLFKSALLLFAAFTFPAQSALYANIIAALFILPFFLFSAAAGTVAAKYDRRSLAVTLKISELCLMLAAALVYRWQSLPALVALLFLMGAQSAFFGPVKYALLPQLLHKGELVKGNAYTEGGTYFSIILGSVLGAALPFNYSLVILAAFAAAGLAAAWQIPAAPAPAPLQKLNLNLVKETAATIGRLKKNKVIWQTVWGITWFWMVGAFCLTQIFPLAAAVFNASPAVVSFFLLLFSAGVGFGAYLSYKILKNRITLFYVPLASLAITLCGFLIFAFSAGVKPAAVALSLPEFLLTARGAALALLFAAMAAAGGIYVVPLNTLLQKTAAPSRLAQIIAGNNIVNAFGMVVVAIACALLVSLGVSVPGLFLLMSLGNLAVAFYISRLYPRELVQSIFRLLLKALYRVECEGFEHMKNAPKKTLVISNHTSLLDGILIAAFLPRSVCFAINTDWTRHPFIRLFSRIIDFYPIDAGNPLSVRSLIGELNRGKTIMMFPEGRISVTGNLMKVYDGAGLIAEAAHAQILPLRIDGANLSKFSYLNGMIKTRWFPKIRLQMLPPQTLAIAPASANATRRSQIADALFKIMKEMMAATEKPADNLYAELKRAARRYGNKKIIEDSARKPLTYRRFIKEIGREARKRRGSLAPEIAVAPGNGIQTAIGLFAAWKIGKTAVITPNPLPVIAEAGNGGTLQNPAVRFLDGTAITAETLRRQWINAYYAHGTNARDAFFSELGLDNADGIACGLLLPLFTGAKLFLNNARKGASDLIYDTDSTVLCLKDANCLHRLGKSASRLDFYALRKVWLFAPAHADEADKALWLARFGLRLKNF